MDRANNSWVSFIPILAESCLILKLILKEQIIVAKRKSNEIPEAYKDSIWSVQVTMHLV